MALTRRPSFLAWAWPSLEHIPCAAVLSLAMDVCAQGAWLSPAGPPLCLPPAGPAGAGLLPFCEVFLFLFLGSESATSIGDPSYSVVNVKERVWALPGSSQMCGQAGNTTPEMLNLVLHCLDAFCLFPDLKPVLQQDSVSAF